MSAGGWLQGVRIINKLISLHKMHMNASEGCLYLSQCHLEPATCTTSTCACRETASFQGLPVFASPSLLQHSIANAFAVTFSSNLDFSLRSCLFFIFCLTVSHLLLRRTGTDLKEKKFFERFEFFQVSNSIGQFFFRAVFFPNRVSFSLAFTGILSSIVFSFQKYFSKSI